jgi:hypothetical protein
MLPMSEDRVFAAEGDFFSAMQIRCHQMAYHTAAQCILPLRIARRYGRNSRISYGGGDS